MLRRGGVVLLRALSYCAAAASWLCGSSVLLRVYVMQTLIGCKRVRTRALCLQMNNSRWRAGNPCDHAGSSRARFADNLAY